MTIQSRRQPKKRRRGKFWFPKHTDALTAGARPVTHNLCERTGIFWAIYAGDGPTTAEWSEETKLHVKEVPSPAP